MIAAKDYVIIEDGNHKAGETGKVVSIVPPAGGCARLYEVKFPDGDVTAYDELQIQKAEFKDFCDVCGNDWDAHLLLKCDGETCVYCCGKWDDCACGR